jgi:hypothetical protein
MRLKTQQRLVLTAFAALGCFLIAAQAKLPEILLTRYSASFTRNAFNQLRPGTKFLVLTNLLGLPIDFTVVPFEPTSVPNNPLSRTNTVELVQFGSNGRDLVLMRYSGSKCVDCYKAYEVFVKGAKVVEARSYWYWD